jgi:hypothetical protein
MPVLASIIDVFTRGSDRPVRRLIAYYLFLGLLAFGVALLFPRLIEMLAGKGLEGMPQGQKALTDGLTGTGLTNSFFGPGTLGDVTISTLVILIGTLLLMLPVSWVYMSARSVQGHSQSVVQTLIILPLVLPASSSSSEQPRAGFQPRGRRRCGAIPNEPQGHARPRLCLPEHRCWICCRRSVARGWRTAVDVLQLRADPHLEIRLRP